MKRIILHGEMAELFSSEISVKANTFNDILNGISANYPSFRNYFIQKIIKGVDYVFVDSDSKEINQQYIHLEAKDNIYHMHPRIIGAAGTAGAAGVQGVLGFAQSFGMSWLMNKINKQINEEEGEEYEVITTSSHIYSSNENRVEQGSPVPIIYGQLRVGSKIISSSIHNYDYNYDDAYIYPVKSRMTRLSQLMNGADYNFIETKEIRDLRESTAESFESYKSSSEDSSKRAEPNIDPSTQAKAASAGQDNEPSNSNYSSSAGGEHKVSGPSIGSAHHTTSSATKQASSSSNSRPFLYPVVGQLDFNCRPEGSSSLSVEGYDHNSKSYGSLAWTSKSTSMKVGSRGSFQKLESIGIYKSLEILSEGPIDGLAGPITGARDNGLAHYPNVNRPSLDLPTSNRALISNLKYNSTLGGLVDGQSSTRTCKIESAGANYSPIGTHTVVGDGTISMGHNVSATTQKPNNLQSALIGDITFDDTNITRVINEKRSANPVGPVSDTKLFTLRTEDGSIHPNTNSTLTEGSNDYRLLSKYMVSEGVGLADPTGVYNITALQSDKKSLGFDYNVGGGYGIATKTIDIAPDNADAKFKTRLKKLNAFDRNASSSVLDIGTDATQLKENISDPRFADLYNDYKARANPLSNSTWSEAVRIYLDSASSTIAGNLGASTTVTIGQYQRRFRTININMTITLSQYVSLDPVAASNPNGGAMNIQYVANKKDALGNVTNAFTQLADGTIASIDLGILLRNSAFANVLWNAFRALLGNQTPMVTTVRTVFGRNHNGGNYMKFCPGTGSNARPNLGMVNGGTPSLGGFNNLNNVKILSDGTNPKEDTPADSRGLYYPGHWPRVTIFCLRKYEFGVGSAQMNSFFATNIDCVAEVSAKGKIAGIHLLNVPDEPVFDPNIGGGIYTPILPQDIKRERPLFFANENDPAAASYKYQDLGFYCKIDDSSPEGNVSFLINENGQIKNDFNGNYNTAARRSLINIETSWSNHIRYNNPSHISSFAGGIFNQDRTYPTNSANAFTVQQDVLLDQVPAPVSDPTSPAVARISVEVLDLNNMPRVLTLSNDWQAAQRFISTGRPTALSIASQGGGYNRKSSGTGAGGTKISKSIFNTAYGVDVVEVDSGTANENKGYKPNSSFVFYGYSNFALGRLNAAFLWRANTLKAKANVDKHGRISTVDIIDPGYGFSPTLSINDCPINSVNLAQEVSAFAFEMIHGFSLGQKKLAEWNFPKSDLILEAKMAGGAAHLDKGSLIKFYVKQVGSGFIYSQFIKDPFSSVSFTPPTFLVTVGADKTITKVVIDAAAMGVGYSADDLSVLTVFRKGGIGAITVVDDATNDPHAWARSIYLNDVPIRDRNDRFNYSKFDFDMRIGHVKNGNGDSHLDPATIRPIDSSLIKREFVLPSYTTVNNYKLFGPRNDGDKDYYFTHTIKNPNVTNVSLSIKVNKLHYIYEGDESTLYMNLIPILLATMGYMIGTSVMKGIIARMAVPDPVVTAGMGRGSVGPCGGPVVTGVTTAGATTPGKPSAAVELAIAAAEALLIFAGGVLGVLLGLLAASVFSCKRIPWLCFKVGEVIKNSGEIWPAQMLVRVEYGVEGEDMAMKTFAFRGCATNPYVKDILIENLPSAGGYKNNYKNRIIKAYRITREMDPVRGGIIEARYQLDVELAGVTEYVEGFFTYPNTAIIGTRVNSKDHPSIPKREYLIKGRRIQIPNNYNPSNGAYSGDWDGTFRTGTAVLWTSNPAWIIYDLLINERYGVGKYGIKESDLDKWSFYTFAKRCDEMVDAVVDGKSTTERRHMCNLYLDGQEEAYTYINKLLDIYSCSLNFSSGVIYITQDSPKDALMIFTNSNVSEDGFKYSVVPKTTRITACSVDYVDERDNYMKKTEYVEDPEGVTKYGYSHVSIPGLGVTRRGEAHRLAWHKILTRQIENEIITFKAGLETSYLRIGDVVQVVDNKKISKHSGGKISKVISSTSVELDIPASLLSTVTSIYIEVPVKSDDISDTSDSVEIASRRALQYKEYTINARNGFELTLTSPLDSSIKAGFNWIIKDNAADKIKPKEYKIENLKEVSELTYEVTALEYVREKFDDIDASTSSKDGINLDEREYYGHTIIV